MTKVKREISKTIHPVECGKYDWTVVYVIDVPGKTPLEAAKAAQNIMRNPEFGEFYHVLHHKKGVFEVDLDDNSVEDVTDKPEVD